MSTLLCACVDGRFCVSKIRSSSSGLGILKESDVVLIHLDRETARSLPP